MFDSSFPFTLIQRTPKQNDKYLEAEHLFQFYSSQRRNIILVEQYDFNVYAVKFYPANKKNQPNRFNILLNDFEFAPIIRTCVNVMLWLLERNMLASFAYIGANTITDNYTEVKSATKRYRIYEYVMDAFLNPDAFSRVFSIKNSAMLLVNKRNEKYEEMTQQIINMFTDLYSELEPIS